MIDLSSYIRESELFKTHFTTSAPWEITARAKEIIEAEIQKLNTNDFIINDSVAIHRSAVIEQHVVFKAPVIILANCFVAAHAYLRGGVFLGDNVSVGPGCEIKSSFIFSHSALAHFNFVGDSIIGSGVNMEAGSVIANHYNERKDKSISVLISDKITPTGVTKFGALVGDDVKIGANAVLSPGTILKQGTIVERLQLVQQFVIN